MVGAILAPEIAKVPDDLGRVGERKPRGWMKAGSQPYGSILGYSNSDV
jgi:hypothetical protein